MKTQINKYIALTGAVLLLLTSSCVKENPLEPNAEFTTNLTDNTAYVNEPFTLYLDNVQGEFLTLFSGLKANSRYNPDDGTVRGDYVDVDADSLEVIYYTAEGKYRLTLVASSSGNWSDDYVIDTFGIDLTVIDRDVRLDFIKIDDISGVFSEDGTEIYFYTHSKADISAKKPEFRTSSGAAVVSIDGVVQESKKSVVDFSGGRDVVYKVTSPSGEFVEYTVKYILSDPSSEKQLLTLVTPFGVFAADQSKKEVHVVYPGDEDVTDVECQATGSLGARILVDDNSGAALNLAERDYDVDLTSGTVTVEAEDKSTQDYDIVLYPTDELASLTFIQSGGNTLNPSVAAVIDGTSVTLTVLKGTNLSSIVAEFTGITTNKLYLGTTELSSGVTVANFSGSPVLTQKASDGKVLITYNLVIEEVE